MPHRRSWRKKGKKKINIKEHGVQRYRVYEKGSVVANVEKKTNEKNIRISN